LALLLLLVRVTVVVRKNCVVSMKQFVVMAIIVGMGFQAFENFSYFAQYARDDHDVILLTAIRIIQPLHWACTGLAGSFVVQQHVDQGFVSIKCASSAVALPILFHFVHNAACLYWGHVFAYIVLIVSGVASTLLLAHRIRKF
jgi:RsiW-degrading membrane proteinase PrsW (M82 family)